MRRTTPGVATIAAAFGLATSTATAASSIVSIDFGAPKAEIATTLKVRTISEVGSAGIFVKYRAAGGPACAPTPDTDPGVYAEFNGDAVASGDLTSERVETFRVAGAFQFCAWLRQLSGSFGYIATTSGTFTVTSPVGAITGVALPTPTPRARPFLVTLTGTSEVARNLYTALRPAREPACAASLKLDPAYSSGAYTATDVFGAFSAVREFTIEKPGTYRLCSWVASSATDLSPLGVNETAITVPAPITVASVRPKLTRVVTSGRNLTARIRLVAPGRLKVALVRNGRRIGLAGARVDGPKTVSVGYRRARGVAPGTYILEIRFAADNGPLVIVRRGVSLR